MTKQGIKTRDILSAYRRQLRVVQWQRRRVQELRYGTQSRSAVGRGSGCGDPTAQTVERLDAARKELTKQLMLLRWRRGILDCYLRTVSDPMTRRILYLRYWKGLTWQQIAQRIGGNMTGDAARMSANRWLDAHPLLWLSWQG